MPPKKQDTSTASVVHPISCRLDVRKKTVAACVLWTDQDGREQTEQKGIGTLTDELIALKEWLLAHECPVVAIESTGVYWQPVHNVLEDTKGVLRARFSAKPFVCFQLSRITGKLSPISAKPPSASLSYELLKHAAPAGRRRRVYRHWVGQHFHGSLCPSRCYSISPESGMLNSARDAGTTACPRST